MTFTTIARLFIIAGVAAVTLPVAATANAQTPSDQRLAATERRDARQDQRIANGLANGSINTNEAARLNARQARIDASQARLAADGRFSRRDYARVNARQARAGAGITRARYNRR